jgi:hypothetical protein
VDWKQWMSWSGWVLVIMAVLAFLADFGIYDLWNSVLGTTGATVEGLIFIVAAIVYVASWYMARQG